MLRDETPRGFIEERRGEKEKGRKAKEEKRKKEKCRSWLCSNSKEHSRRTLSLAFSRSLSSPFCLSLFFNPAKPLALQRDENPAGHR